MLDLVLTPEQQALRQRVRQLAETHLRPLAPTIDESAEIPWAVVRLLADEGLFALVVPRACGGTDEVVSAVKLCLVREELARVSAQADVLFTLQGLGSQPIVLGGSADLQRAVLPPVVRGEALAAFALTEPEAGSDVAALRTTARRDGDDYVLDGDKRFVSNAGAAHVYSVFASTDPSRGAKGISAFYVAAGTPGLDFGPPLVLLAAHCIGQPRFRGCRVPATQRLGAEGEGFRIAMQTLDLFRPSVGAAAVGLGQAAYEEALRYARRRKQFGAALVQQQAIRFKLADMAVALDAARLLVYRAAVLKDRGAARVTKEAAMAKLFATEAAWRVVDEAVQIHGGSGVSKEYAVERYYRQVRSMRIYEGTSEIQRLIIANELLRETEG
ncbi:MAG: acyl-CoA dehydrogenase family protein [Chloroflexi bacterium]|nr:acyl-CoA dehydrogenase family protein [Chloroflexota bacterium]